MYVILGAGAAGLSAAYFLRQRGIYATVLEKGSTYGGLARSFRWNDFWCDFAAHRLFTDDPEVLRQVSSLVRLHEHQRRSKIFLRGVWMSDPIDVIELATHLPPAETMRLARSYLVRNRSLLDDSFEGFVLRRYGRELYEVFFRAYTERLFSLPGDQIAVEWARRKVRLASPFDRFKRATKTKFPAFYYPVRGGYGAIVNALYAKVQDQVVLDARVTGLEPGPDGRIVAVHYERAGTEHRLLADVVISTLPLTLNARFVGQTIPLEYQKVDAVYLLLDRPQMTENHWLYFMDAESAINRLVEFKQMSSEETDPRFTVVCAEVTRDEADPVGAVVANLVRTGLIEPGAVLDSKVIREPFAYPRYTRDYPTALRAFSEQLDRYSNFYLLGRAAQFEHLEVDDLFGAAFSLVNDLTTARPHVLPAPTAVEPQKVWVVVLAWNNYADTAECLGSLGRLAYSSYQVVLVDNGSTDGTPQRVREQFPDVVVIENGANIGVPFGYNVGFRYALDHGANYVFMINNDTTVDPLILNHLVLAARHQNAGILAPIVYYYDQPTEVWSSGARYRAFPPAIVFERRIFPTNGHYHELEYALSCGLLITRTAFERAGLFDENFRFLWDDHDFSKRVRDAGLTILQVPQARMWHKVSRTTQPGSALFWQVHGESGAIYFRRHGRLVYLDLVLHMGYFGLREIVYKRRWKFLRPFLAGLRRGLTRELHEVPRIKDNLSYPG